MTTNTPPTLAQAQTIAQALQPYVENMAGIVAMSRQYTIDTRYCAGYLDGLQLALAICEEVNKHAGAT